MPWKMVRLPNYHFLVFITGYNVQYYSDISIPTSINRKNCNSAPPYQ